MKLQMEERVQFDWNELFKDLKGENFVYIQDGSEAELEYFKAQRLKWEAIKRQQELEMLRLMAQLQTSDTARERVKLLEEAQKLIASG